MQITVDPWTFPSWIFITKHMLGHLSLGLITTCAPSVPSMVRDFTRSSDRVPSVLAHLLLITLFTIISVITWEININIIFNRSPGPHLFSLIGLRPYRFMNKWPLFPPFTGCRLRVQPK